MRGAGSPPGPVGLAQEAFAKPDTFGRDFEQLVIAEKVEVRDGMLAIPDRPGLGITMREDIIAKHAVRFE